MGCDACTHTQLLLVLRKTITQKEAKKAVSERRGGWGGWGLGIERDELILKPF